MNTYLFNKFKRPSLLFIILVFSIQTFSAEHHHLCSLGLLGRRQFLTRNFKLESPLIKVAFFDADDTIRKTKSGKPAPDGPEDVTLLPGIAKKIKKLNEAGYLVVLVSNQAGVQYGKSIENIDLAFLETIRLLRLEGAEVNYYDFAERNDVYRKPKTGMYDTLRAILKAELGSKVEIDKRKSFMVGDAAGQVEGPKKKRFDSDIKFAQNLGIAFFEAKKFRESPELFPEPESKVIKIVRDEDKKKSAKETPKADESLPKNQPLSAETNNVTLATEEEIQALFDTQLPNRIKMKSWEFKEEAFREELANILKNPPSGYQWIPLSFFSGGSLHPILDLEELAKREFLVFSHASNPQGNLDNLIENETPKTNRGFLDSIVLGKPSQLTMSDNSLTYFGVFNHATNGPIKFRIQDKASTDFTDSSWVLMPAQSEEYWRRLAFERINLKNFLSPDLLTETNIKAIAKIFHLYAELPATYGATAIAGTLRGRNVNKILKRRPEYAEFKDVPYNFLFTMAELMEKFIKATTSAKTKDADWQHWIQARDKASTQGACYIYEKLSLELLNDLK